MLADLATMRDPVTSSWPELLKLLPGFSILLRPRNTAPLSLQAARAPKQAGVQPQQADRDKVGSYHVPKHELVSVLQLLLLSGHLNELPY